MSAKAVEAAESSFLLKEMHEQNKLGQMAFLKGNYEQAQCAFVEAIAISQQIETKECGELLGALYANLSRAILKDKPENYRLAIVDAEKAIQLRPTWFRGYQRRAEAYAEMFSTFSSTPGKSRSDILEAMRSNISKACQLLTAETLQESRVEVEKLRESYFAIPSSIEQDPKVEALVKWTQSQDASIKNVEIRTNGSGFRSVFASRDVRQGEEIMKIPLKALMTLDLALKECLTSQTLQEKKVEVHRQVYLACYLLEQRALGEKSRWHDYIQSLPREFPAMPCLYDEKQLAELQKSNLVDMAQLRKTGIENDYKLMVEHVPDFTSKFSLQDFYWARLVILTRVFSIILDSSVLPKLTTEALVPLADLLNHKQTATTEWKFKEKAQAFTVTSSSDVVAGSEIFDSYGRKCNTVLANGYGFALADNPDNTVRLIVRGEVQILSTNYRHETTVRCFSLLRHLFHDFQQTLDKHPIVLPPNKTSTPRTPDQEKALKNQIQTERFKNFLAPDHGTHVQSSAFDAQTEHYTVAALSEICKRKLDEYPTTLAQDEAQWQEHNSGKKSLSASEVVILLVRRGEKIVLQHYVDLLKQVQTMLQLNDILAHNSKIKGLLKNFWKEHHLKARTHPLSDYLVTIWEKL